MLRTPIPNAERSRLENFGTDQLLGIFKSCLTPGSRRVTCSELAEAWGTLFSDMYLSADDLVDGMQSGEHRLGEEDVRMLREFIRADCATGGAFVLDVIKKGGKIDRAALIMIADPENLAGVEHEGTTAIHLLAEACDKGVRPALIGQAGKRLLAGVYDGRGFPVLFSIFSLTDLCRDDLDAIAKVYSEDDLKKIMIRNRTGKNAFEVFIDASERLKYHAPGERNKFFVSHAIKTTNMEGDLRTQVGSDGQHGHGSGVPVADGQKAEGEGGDSATGVAERYEAMTENPLDNMGKMMRKMPKNR